MPALGGILWAASDGRVPPVVPWTALSVWLGSILFTLVAATLWGLAQVRPRERL